MLQIPENRVFKPRNNLCGRLIADTWSDVVENSPEYKLGEKYNIYLKNHDLGVAELVALRPINYSHIRDPLAYLVSGNPSYFLATLLKEDKNITSENLVHLVFKWEIRNLENQEPVFGEWWSNTCKYGRTS